MRRPCKEETDSMRCTSCKEECVTLDAGTCKRCSEEVSETEEELKREVENLKAKVAFLSFWSPTGRHCHLSGCSHGPGFTDVVLVAAKDGPNGDPSMPVPAHRAILASRSTVFKAMLENEMEESQSGTIKMSDMSCDALRAFVDYLYAEAWLDEQMACELLVLAEKHQVVHLKAYCEMILVSKLNWDNSIKYYAFVHQQNAKVLLEAALCLILDNIYELQKHQDYWEFVNKDPRLMLKIYRAFLGKF
ncbi:BTB/POZ domain-containing protein At4g08455-like [Rhodamnia argentea]|uniref:BTB/POZ domain-containing protein At4g08455-like n=1 Tax=Rhodamnia argentea TaxID=178133 RepID=A0A8B8QDJ2_9MYRT|nr:BTB/POZ domain-containing protein At4g08455-like [Rhodamnia argentea]